MNARTLRRYFDKARADRKLKRFQEVYQPSPAVEILCESQSEYDLWSEIDGSLKSFSRNDWNRVSLRGLLEELVPNGRELVQSWANGTGGYSLQEALSQLREDAGANTAAQFSNITGQIVYNRILQAFEAEEYVFSKLIPNVPTQFNGEKIAGISRIGDEAQVVPEGRPYPLVGVSEDYIQTPATVKRGMIDALTKEAIFFDRTGVLISRCAEVGEFLGLNKEKRLIDAVLDQNAGAVTGGHRYNWKGTTYATYQTSTPWVNSNSGNGLTDWSNVDSAEQTLAAIADPWTGEPIMIQPKDMIVARAKLFTARRIVTATRIETVTPGFATSANPNKTEWANPIQQYRIVSSQLMGARMSKASEATSDWFIGDLAKAVNYMENFPLTVVNAPTNSQAEFERDIVMQWKANERGAAAVVEPRALVKQTT
jgi:hypothetical protein